MPRVCPAPEHRATLDRLHYEPLLPEGDIRASINSAGLAQRMRIAIDKALRGVLLTLIQKQQALVPDDTTVVCLVSDVPPCACCSAALAYTEANLTMCQGHIAPRPEAVQ